MYAKSIAGLVIVFSGLTVSAAPRAFVASTGNDANAGCTLPAPCRSFQAAHTAVDPKGEIVALDTAGYGAVSISKSVTIMANPGVVAGIAVTSGVGVTIAPGTSGVSVILRGLSINNVGTGTRGIQMTAGDLLAIENCVISGFDYGASVQTAAKVRVVNTLMRGNNSYGLYLSGGVTAEVVSSQFLGTGPSIGVYVLGLAGGSPSSVDINDSVSSGHNTAFSTNSGIVGNGVVQLTCTRCIASHNVTGFHNVAGAATGSAQTFVTASTVSHNSFGFVNDASSGGTATFQTLGNNALAGNSTDSAGTITPVPGT